MRKYFWETYTMTRFADEYFHKQGEIPISHVGFGHQEFLREVYGKCEDNKELQEKSEEGFLFLTDRSNHPFCKSHNSAQIRGQIVLLSQFFCVQIRGVAMSEASVRDERGKSCPG